MGKKFNKTHQSPSNIHWSDDEQTINYLGQPVVLAKIESMCHTLIGELQELMDVLTFGSPVPPIDLSRIVNSMAWSQAFRRQNFSFITHAQNQDQVAGDYRFLLERARKKESDAIKGADIIQRRLGRVQASQEQMIAVMDRLQGDCIYCGLMHKEHARGRAHAYKDCRHAVETGCGITAYEA